MAYFNLITSAVLPYIECVDYSEYRGESQRRKRRAEKKPKPGSFLPGSLNHIHGSGQLVELGCHCGLLVSCIVLVKQTLGSRAVDCLNCNFIGIDGIVLVAFGNSCVWT